MTSTLLSPSRIAAPIPGQYPHWHGDPPPTQSVSTAFDPTMHLPYHKATILILEHRDLNQWRGDYSTVVPVPKQSISAYIDAKSP